MPPLFRYSSLFELFFTVMSRRLVNIACFCRFVGLCYDVAVATKRKTSPATDGMEMQTHINDEEFEHEKQQPHSTRGFFQA